MIAKIRSHFADIVKRNIKMKQKLELADLVCSIYGSQTMFKNDYDSERSMGLVVDIVKPVITSVSRGSACLEEVYCVEWLTGAHCGVVEKFSGEYLMKL